MPDLLPAIEIETQANPRFSVIWMHGLGADGSDFVPIVPYLRLPVELAVRFIFPHAPSIAVTCNGGYVMPAWYDIRRIDGLSRDVDAAGVEQSCRAIRRRIAHEVARGIASEHIVLAGFSQGGAIAYTAGLTHPDQLAGIVALSTYLPAPDLLRPELLEANRDTPVFAAHGSQDDVVAPPYGIAARDHLQAAGYTIEWHSYAMPHSVCEEEIADIGAWLVRVLGAGRQPF